MFRPPVVSRNGMVSTRHRDVAILGTFPAADIRITIEFRRPNITQVEESERTQTLIKFIPVPFTMMIDKLINFSVCINVTLLQLIVKQSAKTRNPTIQPKICLLPIFNRPTNISAKQRPNCLSTASARGTSKRTSKSNPGTPAQIYIYASTHEPTMPLDRSKA